MTVRIRFAVQYPPKKGSGGKEPLYWGQRSNAGPLLDAMLISRASARWQVKLQAKYPSARDVRTLRHHLPARVVRVKETITREIME